MKEVNLEKILEECMGTNKWYLGDRLKDDIIIAMRSACIQTIILCSENAFSGPDYINRELILKTKEQII